MIIVGGTYSEICFEPIWENIFGSGFRAVSLLLEYDNQLKIDYYTCVDKEIKAYLGYHVKLNSNLTLHPTDIFKSPIFQYDYPLKAPTIAPRPDLYFNKKPHIEVHGKNILAYGLLEASINLDGHKVVYDPQSPVNPQSFSSTGSKAEQLITIVNYSEAKLITGSSVISVIVDYFLKTENCFAFILKMGAKGALVFENGKTEIITIPVYETNQVWPIGSGDIYSAFFAYNWFQGKEVVDSAKLASKATAIYCNSMDLSIKNKLHDFKFPELLIEKEPQWQIYLAGPFFTFAERWLVNEIRNTFMGFNLKVFSPFHDVGHGKAIDVVDKDLKGIDESKVVFAIIDGLDSGTLFEIGYAVAEHKKVIAFVQNENEESLKMLEGTNCIIESDLTTAIYKTYWLLAKS